MRISTARLAAILPAGLLAVAQPADAADGSINRCEYSVQYQVFNKAPGYASTSAESYWVTDLSVPSGKTSFSGWRETCAVT